MAGTEKGMTELILGPTFETERLILRPPSEADLDAWAEMSNDEEAMRYLGGIISRAETWRVIAGTIGAWVIRGYGMFSVIEKKSNAWVGRIGPLSPEGWPGTEVGWGLHPAYFGKGYATEAATRCMDWVFDDLGWTDAIHCIAPENKPSQKVAERLGSRNRGPGKLPPPWQDKPNDLWGQTREQWRARQR